VSYYLDTTIAVWWERLSGHQVVGTTDSTERSQTVPAICLPYSIVNNNSLPQTCARASPSRCHVCLRLSSRRRFAGTLEIVYHALKLMARVQRYQHGSTLHQAGPDESPCQARSKFVVPPALRQLCVEIMAGALAWCARSNPRGSASYVYSRTCLLVNDLPKWLHGCPCGYFGDPTRECTCSLSMVSRYQKRLSGPLLDRIDIHIDVPRVDYEKLTDDRLGEPSEKMRQRVEKARRKQRERFANGRLSCNADMGPAEVREYCPIDDAGRSLLRAAMEQLQMSARAFHRVLKLGRTIADLAGSDEIETAHLAEALQYRPRTHM
jgi:hypothetical protein